VAVWLVSSSTGAPQPRRVKLPQPIARAIDAHERLAAHARESPEALCAVIVNARALLPEIERDVKDDDQDRLKVTGLYIVTGPEFSRSGVDYGGLAKLASTADGRLLRAMAEFEGTAGGVSNETAWIDALTDFSGCHHPSKATKPLAELVQAWLAASACLHEAVAADLNTDLSEMASDTFFCDEPVDQRMRAVRQNAALMRKLTGTRGPELAPQMKRTAAAAKPAERPSVPKPLPAH
ncbi:MAG: hypothetical protein ACJ8F1_22610, partial [Polyangia bacterium]